jgi:hypothetical protein
MSFVLIYSEFSFVYTALFTKFGHIACGLAVCHMYATMSTSEPSHKIGKTLAPSAKGGGGGRG